MMYERLYCVEQILDLHMDAQVLWIFSPIEQRAAVSKGFLLNALIENKLRRAELFLRHSDVYYMITRSPHDNV